jgi:hypothetical protein
LALAAAGWIFRPPVYWLGRIPKQLPYMCSVEKGKTNKKDPMFV